MKLFATLLVRNEDWIVGLSMRVLLSFCDAIVVLEHLCTDRTHDIICEVAEEDGDGRVILTADDDEHWSEMRLRQKMLEIARQYGATHIWLGDADEIIDSVTAHMARPLVAGTPQGHIMCLPLYNLRGSINRYHLSGMWGNRITSVAFKDSPELGWVGDKHHSREPVDIRTGKYPLKTHQPIQQGQGGILHAWGVPESRLIAKHRAYRVRDSLHWPQMPHREIESLYSMATEGRPQHGDVPARWTYADVPANWWYPDLMKYLDVDAEPWQEGYVNEMIKLHGRDRFAGLKV